MGKELPMARKERERSVLLVRTSTGEFVPASSSRKKGKKDACPSKGETLSQAVSAEKESKSSPEAEVPDDAAYKAKRRGRDNKARKSARRHEGRDSSSRRDAKRLGIEWPEDRCWESPTHAHWFTAGSHTGRGSIWLCKYCWRAKWIPDFLSDTEKFAKDIRSRGIDEAYRIWVDRMPSVVKLLRKLEDLRLIRKTVPKKEFLEIVAAVMSDKEYPYEEEK